GQQMRLSLTALLVGFGVMSVELTASRLMAPHFGASIFVWTGIIVVVLVALAFGYWTGGRAAERNAGLSLVGGLLCGAGIFLLLLLRIFPALAAHISLAFSKSFSASMTVFLATMVVSALAFACPLFLLAMSGPILLKAWAMTSNIGRCSGQYLTVST